MGWASAGEIFDDVARGMIEAGADDGMLDLVLTKLARSLSEQDWDTEDESVQQFNGYPVVQNAIRKGQGWVELDGPGLAGYFRLEYEPAGDRWLVKSTEDDTITAKPGTWRGYNRALMVWAQRYCGPDAAEMVELYRLG